MLNIRPSANRRPIHGILFEFGVWSQALVTRLAACVAGLVGVERLRPGTGTSAIRTGDHRHRNSSHVRIVFMHVDDGRCALQYCSETLPGPERD
eukprot:scaffold64960_cov38-Prasinocladus_malaysianus.AAC.1